MSTISRITTWTSGQTLTASALNGEFNGIVNAWNNQDSGAATWSVMKANSIQGTLGANIAGGGFVLTGLGNGASSGQSLAYGQLAPGLFKQIVSVTQTTATSTTSNAYSSTSLTTSITPGATTSKIVVLVCGNMRLAGTVSAYATVFRGVTDLDATGFGLTSMSTANMVNPCTILNIDSPASTSALTYTLKIKNSDNTTTVQWNNSTGTTVMYLLELGQ